MNWHIFYNNSEQFLNNKNLPATFDGNSNATSKCTITDDNDDRNIVSTSTDNLVDVRVKRCSFCNKRYKRLDNRNLPLSFTNNFESFGKIKCYATKWHGVLLLNKINSHVTDGSMISYHRYSETSYNVTGVTKGKDKTESHITRNHYY